MKKIIALVTVLLIAINSFADNGKMAWPELMAIQKTISLTLHSDNKGNMQIVPQKVHELFIQTHKFKISKFPDEYNTPRIRQAVVELEKATDELEKMISKKATSDIIKDRGTKVQEAYQHIQDLCFNGKTWH